MIGTCLRAGSVRYHFAASLVILLNHQTVVLGSLDSAIKVQRLWLQHKQTNKKFGIVIFVRQSRATNHLTTEHCLSFMIPTLLRSDKTRPCYGSSSNKSSTSQNDISATPCLISAVHHLQLAAVNQGSVTATEGPIQYCSLAQQPVWKIDIPSSC